MNATPPHIARVPRIAITPGEPAGIGPDLCVTLAQRAHGAELVAVADPVLLMQRAAELHLPLALLPFDRAQAPQPQAAGTLRVAPVPLCAPTRAGVLDAANAAYVLDTLRRGAEGCVDTEFDALVTGPVHKGVINDAGVEFSGHAEFLAGLTHTPQVVMLLLTEGLRVAMSLTPSPRRISPAYCASCIATCTRVSASRRRASWSAGSTPMPARAAISARKLATWSNRCCMRCAAKAWTSWVRCPPTRCSSRNTSTRPTRCSPCTTIKACRCRNSRVSARP